MVQRIKGEIPNSITCLNLLCGCLAVIFAVRAGNAGPLEGYQWSFLFIGLAAIFDFCDGAMARLINAYSPVGKELDSLSDLVSFGVAPAMLVFNTFNWAWSSTEPYWLLPYFSLMIAVCGGIRLARFNVDTRQTTEFIGLPIPANAIFWIGAVSWLHTYEMPAVLAVYLIPVIVIVSLLMLAPMRLFSLKFKNFALAENWYRYLLLAAAVIFVALLQLPGLALLILFYVVLSYIVNAINNLIK